MMLVPLVFGIPASPTADQLLDRLTNRLKNGFAVDFTLKHSVFNGEIKGHYEYMPTTNAYFRATGAGSDFTFVVRKDGAIEIENTNRTYYEIGPMGDIMTTSSSLSLLSTRAFPYLIGRAKPRTAFPDQGKFRYVRAESVDSVPGHRIVAGEGKESIEAWIAEDGRILRYVHNSVEDYRSVSADFRFGPLGKPNASKFSLLPPKGYRPLALPRNPQPLYPGLKIPVSGWMDRKGSKVSLPLKAETILVITRGDCPVTARARGLIAELAEKTTVLVLSDSGVPKGLEKYPLYRDPGRSTIDRFMTQATPFFIAVNASGQILGTWMGFNPKEQAALKKEILAAFGE